MACNPDKQPRKPAIYTFEGFTEALMIIGDFMRTILDPKPAADEPQVLRRTIFGRPAQDATLLSICCIDIEKKTNST